MTNLAQPLSSLITPKEQQPKPIVARRKKDRASIVSELLNTLKKKFPELEIQSWSGYGYTERYEHRIYVNGKGCSYGHFCIKRDLSFEARFEMCQDGDVQQLIKQFIESVGLVVNS